MATPKKSRSKSPAAKKTSRISMRKRARTAPAAVAETGVAQKRTAVKKKLPAEARSQPRGKDAAFEKFIEWLEQATKKIDTDDLEALMRRAREIRTSVHGTAAVGYYWNTSKRVFGYLRDYWNGTHRDVPWYSITAAVAAAVYVLSPVDLIPDFVPVLGTLDDAAVIAGCLALIERDLQAREAHNPRATAGRG